MVNSRSTPHADVSRRLSAWSTQSSPDTWTSVPLPPSASCPFSELAAATQASPLLLSVGRTLLGGRGLLLQGKISQTGDVGDSTGRLNGGASTSSSASRLMSGGGGGSFPLLSIPLRNTLVITDEPLRGISAFGDACHREFQVEWN